MPRALGQRLRTLVAACPTTDERHARLINVEGCNFRFTQSANLVIFGTVRLKYQSMKFTVCVVFLFFTTNVMGAQGTAIPAEFDVNAAERFANLALACVHKEYPNKISHTLNSDADVAPPRKLTPAFFGCYDWHSSVHGHWLLVRLVRTFPDASFAPSAREALRQSLTADNVAQEAAYLRVEGRASFERPYGLAWLLQMVAELREWDDPEARDMSASLRPLEQAALERLNDWLPKLSHPVRIGEHDQTAFASGPHAGLRTGLWRHEICRPAGIESSTILFRRQRLSTIL